MAKRSSKGIAAAGDSTVHPLFPGMNAPAAFSWDPLGGSEDRRDQSYLRKVKPQNPNQKLLMDAIKTHNPFAVNDILFSRETGVALDKFNNYGCSLVWGHPQAPMGTRGIIELIEELVVRGGGWGLFTGCAAGDSAMAAVLHVDDGGRGP